MSRFKIESTAPMPAIGRRRKYPFPTMKVGDSFFVARPKGLTLVSLRCRLSVAARYHRSVDPKFNYATRAENNGIRIWRIKPAK